MPERITQSASKPLLTAIPFLIGFALCLFVVFRFQFDIRRADFRAHYAGGYLTRTNPAQLYDLDAQKQAQDTLINPQARVLPFIHPSYEALLVFAPFSLLNYTIAFFAFRAFNCLLLIVLFFVLKSAFKQKIPIINGEPVTLLFLFLPVIVALMQGQDSLLLLLLLTLAWKQLEKGNDLNAGLLLALGLFRFQITLPIALLMAIRKGKKFSLGIAAGGTAVALLSLAITGVHGAGDYIHLIHSTSLMDQSDAAAQLHAESYPAQWATISGLSYSLGGQILNPRIEFLLVAVLSLALLGACAWLIRSQARRKLSEQAAFLVAVLCGLLVSNHLFIHDLSLLLLPVLLTGRKHPRLALALYLLPAILLFVNGTPFAWLAIPIMALLFMVSRDAIQPSLSPCPAAEAGRPSLL